MSVQFADIRPAEMRAMGVVCRACGADVILRKPREGGKPFRPFWGRSRYPHCTSTMTTREVDCIVDCDDDLDPPVRDWGDL